MKTFATLVKENLMLKYTWYLTTRFLRVGFFLSVLKQEWSPPAIQ